MPHDYKARVKYGLGQNPNRTPSEHQPIPARIGTKMGGAPTPTWYHWFDPQPNIYCVVLIWKRAWDHVSAAKRRTRKSKDVARPCAMLAMLRARDARA